MLVVGTSVVDVVDSVVLGATVVVVLCLKISAGGKAVTDRTVGKSNSEVAPLWNKS